MKTPQLHPSVFVAPTATVLGDVTAAESCSFFFGAVARAEIAPITLGARTNIQDNCVLHTDPHTPMSIGEGVTVGHGAILHGCTVGDNTLIGMGAIVLNGAVIGRNCIVAAGALVPQNMVIPDGMLVMGSPAKVRRAVTDEDIAANRRSSQFYVDEGAEYRTLLSK